MATTTDGTATDGTATDEPTACVAADENCPGPGAGVRNGECFACFSAPTRCRHGRTWCDPANGPRCRLCALRKGVAATSEPGVTAA